MVRERLDLSGKWALVTGASRGIGEASALALAECGADIVLVSRKAEGLEQAAAKVRDLGRKTSVIPANVGSPEDVAALTEKLSADGIVPTILINNAGTNPAMANVVDLNEAVWQKVFDINLTGPWRLTRALVPGMRKAGGGAIVNVASIAGLKHAPMLGAYGVSKAALIHLTRVLAAELAPYKIRVNAVAPGLVKTKLSKALFDNEAIYKSAIQGIRLNRHGEPEEIATVIATLASPASSFMTGETVAVDGGAVL